MSRGELSEGEMKGRSVFEFIPVNKNALEISPFLGERLKSWVREDSDILDPGGWLFCGHDL